MGEPCFKEVSYRIYDTALSRVFSNLEEDFFKCVGFISYSRLSNVFDKVNKNKQKSVHNKGQPFQKVFGKQENDLFRMSVDHDNLIHSVW